MYRTMFNVEDLSRLFNTYFNINVKFIVDKTMDNCFLYDKDHDIYYFKYKYLEYKIFFEILSKFNPCNIKLNQFLDHLSTEFKDVKSHYYLIANK